MNEQNWIETTKMRKNLKKFIKKFVKQQKDRQIGNAGDNRRGMKFKQKHERKRGLLFFLCCLWDGFGICSEKCPVV